MSWKIGSHDSMSYLQPYHWWMRPFRFVARCQSVPIDRQYECGARLFDIRVRYYKGLWWFAHGVMLFKGETPDSVFQYLNKVDEKVMVRLILEYNSPVEDMERISVLFECQAYKWCQEYYNITFFGFYRKYDWKKLYDNHIPDPKMCQMVSSMTWGTFDDWWPWFYAWLNNKDNIQQGTDKDYMLMDFVHLNPRQ